MPKPIVPRQPIADEQVYEFWKKKNSLTREEIAALVVGVNPLSWANYDSRSTISADSQQQILDILLVLDQRLNAFDTSNSLADWRTIFRDNELPFPKSLNPTNLDKTQIALQALQDADLAKKLDEISELIGVPILITFWLQHDTWTGAEAMLLLVGLEPRTTIIKNEENIYGEPIRQIEIAGTLDGMESPPRGMLAALDNSRRELEAQWRRLNALWNSGEHKPRNPPSYYIDWANSKNHDIPWLQWAVDNALLPTQDHSSIEKNLSTRERNTYNNIIGALLEVILKKTSSQNFDSQTQLIKFLSHKYGGFPGLGSRTLEKRFAEAKRAIESSEP